MMWHMALSLVSGETVPWTEVNSWGNQSQSCHYLSVDVVKLRPRDMIIYTSRLHSKLKFFPISHNFPVRS